MSAADSLLRFGSTYDVTGQTGLDSFLSRGVNVNLPLLSRRDNHGHDFPLCVALKDANLEACRKLIAAGADVNMGRVADGPPLASVVRAVFNGIGAKNDFIGKAMYEICTLLLENGATVYEPGMEHSPLEVAIGLDSREFAKIMMDHLCRVGGEGSGAYRYDDAGQLVVAPRVNVDSALCHAVAAEVEGPIPALLRAGGSDDRLWQDNLTLLQLAVSRGWDSVVEFYAREREVDLRQKNKAGRSLLQMAKKPSIKQMLLSLKAGEKVENALSIGINSSETDQASHDMVTPKNNRGMQIL